ncbi:metal ABC transporter substrate-binding protein [Salinirubellus salinus]|uniref:Metal ABC transporter substrate-binding protein n=1 Tax=Salinirubellus salinus TaxID=1364945 RepID=A0A9E7R162_9EURY|nr:metal ABC transporter substrate-binding protein [Salinirubellus salinus]UWM52735.1 metal ABC transporter substrate-binding protein [Salinirubellus salinus]
MELTRRRLVTSAGAAGAGLLAGCLGSGDAPGADSEAGADGLTAQSSFFVFGDITAQVAGGAATADLLVPVGQHGHGWEPGPRVREAIGDADLLVHGMTGFQPWLDTIRTDLEADGSEVVTVDVSSEVDLLAPGEEHDHDGEHDEEEHHDEEHTEEHHDEEHTEEHHDEEHTEEHHDEEHTEEHHDDEHTEEEHHDEEHTEEHHDEDEHDEEDGHDHGSGMDPHFWMDPLRVKTGVDTVEAALADLDSENAATYEENAAAFRDRLDGLHERIEATVADATTETILVAGHDSFQYFGERYGVEVEALTNVSPDDRPTPRDIERAQAVIEDHGLRYICADPLESQRAAEQLVAETEAEAVLPLTAMPGLTDEWESEGWGYVEVMENVNLPTLERALGV